MENKILTYTLNDGFKIPAIGLGTYGLRGSAGVKSILTAIDHGYRLIDTAFNYENEGVVGKAVQGSPVAREELLISSKLPGRHHSYNEALYTIEESLYRAHLDYYDFYLIHWPNPKTDQYVEAWQALIEAKNRGLIHSIGVCNFLPEHLLRLEKETGILPSLNQIELHPFFNEKSLNQFNLEHGIRTESWSPLGRGNQIMSTATIQAIANHHQKTPTQVILRWHVQSGSVCIPKASSSGHQLENLNIFDFELHPEEMEMIDLMNHDDGRLQNQDPATYEEF